MMSSGLVKSSTSRICSTGSVTLRRSPDRRRRTPSCHIHLLKPSYDRNLAVRSGGKTVVVVDTPPSVAEGDTGAGSGSPGPLCDGPTRANHLQHHPDVGDAALSNQLPSRVNPGRRQVLSKDLGSTIHHGVAEPSSSRWSSPA